MTLLDYRPNSGAGSALNAKAAGVVGGNTGNQATAIAAADTRAAAAGVPLFFPLDTYRATAGLTATTDWIFDRGSILSCPTDLLSNAVFLDVLTGKHVDGCTVRGSNINPGLGVAPNATTGIRLNPKARLRDVAVQGFKQGVRLFGDHIRMEHVTIGGGCYYGLYFPASMPSDGNLLALDVDVTGCVFASIGVADGGGVNGHDFYFCHFGFSPYGVYKEGGANQAIILASTFTASPIENVGNGAIFDGAGNNNNFVTGAKLPTATWDATYRLSGPTHRALYDVPVMQRNEFHFGELSGIPAFGIGTVSVIYCGNFSSDNTVFPGQQLADWAASHGGAQIWAGGNDRTNTMQNEANAAGWLARWNFGTATRGDVMHLTGNNVARADGTKAVAGVALETRSGDWIPIQESGRCDLVVVNASVSADAALTPDSGSAGRVKTATLWTDRLLGIAATGQASTGQTLTAVIRPTP